MPDADISLIRIALVGRTGGGKTTLITTFRKAYSGLIGDKANTTKEAKHHKPIDHESLQAIFVDCPGFLNAVKMKDYFRAKTKGEAEILEFEQNCIDDNIDISFDKRALKALEKSDVVLYIGDGRIAPENSHEQELQIVQKIQTKVIGVLNKIILYEKEKGQEGAKNRINQWQKIFTKNGVQKMVVFDPHWDKPSKVIEIYDAVLTILPPEKKHRFETGLENFKARQQEINQKAYELLAEEVLLLKSQKIEEEKVDNPEETKKNLEKRILELLKKCVVSFNVKVSEWYRIAAENPTLSAKDLSLTYTMRSTRRDIVSGASTGGAMGGLIGGTVVTVAAVGLTILTGGAAIPVIAATAATAAGIGAAGGGAVGAVVGGVKSTNKRYQVDLSEGSAEYFAEICITTIYALSHHGYGGKPIFEKTQFEELQKKVQELKKQRELQINWFCAEKSEIITWCEKILSQLDY